MKFGWLFAFCVGWSLVYCVPVSATTVACDGRIIASDSQATQGSRKSNTCVKLAHIRDAIIGCAGPVNDIVLFRNWYQKGANPNTYPKVSEQFEAIVFTKKGLFAYWDKAVPFEEKVPMAIGSGADAAMGAMMAGADAKKAVDIATQIDLYSCGPVIVHTIQELDETKDP